MATSLSPLGNELERRFYPFAETILRMRQLEPAERQKALKSVYGRHLGYILRLMADWSEEGEYADWESLQTNPTVEKNIAARAKQHVTEKQVKQLYR